MNKGSAFPDCLYSLYFTHPPTSWRYQLGAIVRFFQVEQISFSCPLPTHIVSLPFLFEEPCLYAADHCRGALMRQCLSQRRDKLGLSCVQKWQRCEIQSGSHCGQVLCAQGVLCALGAIRTISGSLHGALQFASGVLQVHNKRCLA